MNTPPTKPAAAPMLKVRFFLSSGAMVEWPVPANESFSFPVLCQNIRANGFFIIADAYIPSEAITFIALEGSMVKLQHPMPARAQ